MCEVVSFFFLTLEGFARQASEEVWLGHMTKREMR